MLEGAMTALMMGLFIVIGGCVKACFTYLYYRFFYPQTTATIKGLLHSELSWVDKKHTKKNGIINTYSVDVAVSDINSGIRQMQYEETVKPDTKTTLACGDVVSVYYDRRQERIMGCDAVFRNAKESAIILLAILGGLPVISLLISFG